MKQYKLFYLLKIQFSRDQGTYNLPYNNNNYYNYIAIEIKCNNYMYIGVLRINIYIQAMYGYGIYKYICICD